MRVLLCLVDTPAPDEPFRSLLPIGLPSIAALLRQEGHRAVVANLTGFSRQRIERLVLSERPRVVGLSVFTHNRHPSRELAETVRRLLPTAVILCGGPHATFSPDEILAWGTVDGIVAGEGEETVREIVRHLSEGPERRLPHIPGLVLPGRPFAPRPPVADLDALPFPHRGLEGAVGVDVPLQAEFIVTSRGCSSHCTFCSSPAFWGGRIRYRPPRSVVAEMKALRDELGLVRLSIRDDTFTADRHRALEICSLMREERLFFLWDCQTRVTGVDRQLLEEMKRSGCEAIQLGVESGSPAILRRLGKGITPDQAGGAIDAARAAGLEVSVYLIAGVPGETAADIDATIDLLRRHPPDDALVSPLVYYPGTPLMTDAIRRGIIPPDLATLPDEAIYATPPAIHRPAMDRLLRGVARSAPRRPPEGGTGWVRAIREGERFLREGDADRARRIARGLCRTTPDNPWGFLLLAQAADLMGDREGARRALEGALSLVPRNRGIRADLENLVKRRRTDQSERRHPC